MTQTDRSLFFWVLYGTVAVVTAAHSYLSRQTPQTAARWSVGAVVAGLVSWLSLLLSRLLHHPFNGTSATWGFVLFAGFELVALRAGYQAISTKMGRWALIACAWPLAVLAVAFVVRVVRALATGGTA